MMSKKESVRNRQNSDEYKAKSARLAESVGGNKPVAGTVTPATQRASEDQPGRRSVSASVLVEQVNVLYANLPVSQAVALANGILLTLVQLNVIEVRQVLSWLACLVLVTLPRIALSFLFKRAAVSIENIFRWRAYFLVGAGASGLVWGSTAFFLYPTESVPHQAFIAFALGGMVAGSMTVLAPVFPVFVLFAVGALVPLIVRFVFAADGIHYAMAGMGTVFLIAMLATGKRIHAAINHSFRLRFENRDLIAYLTNEKARVEAINVELRAAQEELKRSNEVLERRVAERTAALMETARTHEILATHDPLTGLGNRRLLAKRMSAALANARRNNSIVAVVYLDLDEFKQINDTLGHGAGDALLKLVARRLESVVREEDTVARVGGDEFMVLLWQVAHIGDVANVATKLVQMVSQPYVIEEHKVTVTLSAGIGIYPGHGVDAESLMKSADGALYEAKRAGKNTFRVAHPDISP